MPGTPPTTPGDPAEPPRSPAEGYALSAAGLGSNMAAHYEALRELAHQTVRGRLGQRIIDPTELVHESYMRLARQSAETPLRRTAFLALAATVIRNVLVDQARQLQALKRGGQMNRVSLDGRHLAAATEIDLLALDDSLNKLARLDARQARIVELKFFGGLTIDEIATLLETSARTIDAEWALAKAWLHRELQP